MMNMTVTSLAPTPAALDAAPVTAALPAAEAQPAASAAPALADAAPAAFAQWLGLGRQADTAALLSDAAMPAAQSADAPVADAADSADQPAAPDQQNVVLLAAMSMPLMAPPPAPAFIRGASAAEAEQPNAQGATSPAATLPLTAAELRTGLAGAALPAATVLSAALSATVSAQPAARPRAPGAADPALPTAIAGQPVAAQAAPAQAAPAQAAPAQAAPAQAAPAQAMPAQSMPAEAGTTARAAAPAADAKPVDAAQLADDSAAPAADRPAGAFGVGPAATAPSRVAADSVALAGPPTAWRQTLHEALGERLNLQLSNRAEQAVIRLEPPMLGRVEIAIRHSAGALEVTISATHGEVVRQLQAVSENLRSDLAARQFTEVAVTVAAAPRGAQAAPQGDQQGRGRQPAREDQAQDPGRSLAEAGDPSSLFSLNGRA
jgi:flagellar hook-length control protein FliK